MSPSTPPAVPLSIPAVRDLTPWPGQTADEIREWMLAKAASDPEATHRLHRLYYGELRKTCPVNDTADPEYWTWRDTLTPVQIEIASLAKAQKDADPKVQEARKREAERLKQSPEYQAALAKKRADYAAQKGGDVRAYRKGAAALTPKERDERSRAFLREELAAGRNPCPANKYDGRPEIKESTRERRMARHVTCQHILDHASLDLNSKAEVLDLVSELHAAISTTAPDDSDVNHALSLILGAMETLRAAKALQRRGNAYRLHGDIAKARSDADFEAMKDIPGFGIF